MNDHIWNVIPQDVVVVYDPDDVSAIPPQFIEGGDTSTNSPMHEVLANLFAMMRYSNATHVESLAGGIHAASHSLEQLFLGFPNQSKMMDRLIKSYAAPLALSKTADWENRFKGYNDAAKRLLRLPPNLLPSFTNDQLDDIFGNVYGNTELELLKKATENARSLADFFVNARYLFTCEMAKLLGIEDTSGLYVATLENVMLNMLPNAILDMTVATLIDEYHREYAYKIYKPEIRTRGGGYIALRYYNPFSLLDKSKGNIGNEHGWKTIRVNPNTGKIEIPGDDDFDRGVIEMTVREVLKAGFGFSGKLGNMLYRILASNVQTNNSNPEQVLHVTNRIRLERPNVYLTHDGTAGNGVLPVGRVLVTTQDEEYRNPQDPQPIDLLAFMAYSNWKEILIKIWPLYRNQAVNYTDLHELRIIIDPDDNITTKKVPYPLES